MSGDHRPLSSAKSFGTSLHKKNVFKSVDESSDSFSESPVNLSVGNVSKESFTWVGHRGKIKRGILIFDACFESGNLSRVECLSECEYELYIRADTCNPKFRVWFNFIVQNALPKQRVIFNIVNFSKTRSLYREGMSPIVKSTSRPIWYRIPHKNVYYYRCPEHGKNYVMSFAFCFDREDDIYQFCYCYPYTYTMLQTYLWELDHKAYPHYKRELIGSTIQQRRLDLLTITAPENMALNRNKKGIVIFVTARVHPGETPSSFVLQGFIDFMVSDHPLAVELRNSLIFKIVPMLNPDGVYLGNYRCSLMGFDLNRQWQNPSEWVHPTIFATKQLLMKLDQNPLLDVNFFIDIHAHSTLMNGFMYGNIFEDEERAERQAIFPNLLSRFAEDFSLPQTNFNCDSVKAGTGRRTLGGILDERTMCYTLEVSFYSYTNVITGETVPYTEEKYAKLGHNLARTFHEYYSVQGLIRSATNYGPEKPLSNTSSDPVTMKLVSDPENQLSTVTYRGTSGFGDGPNTGVGATASSENRHRAAVAESLSKTLNTDMTLPDEWQNVTSNQGDNPSQAKRGMPNAGLRE